MLHEMYVLVKAQRVSSASPRFHLVFAVFSDMNRLKSSLILVQHLHGDVLVRSMRCSASVGIVSNKYARREQRHT